MPQTEIKESESRRRRFRGVVTSAKMQKTLVVEIERRVKHPEFEKYLKRLTVLKAHDEKGEGKTGDLVEVEETRPLSKTKRWRLVRVVRKAYRDEGGLSRLTVEAESQARREAKVQALAKAKAEKAATEEPEGAGGDDA